MAEYCRTSTSLDGRNASGRQVQDGQKIDIAHCCDGCRRSRHECAPVIQAYAGTNIPYTEYVLCMHTGDSYS